MYQYPVPLQTKDQILAGHLSNWWWRRGQVLFLHAPWQWPQPSHQEQVQAVLAQLSQDAELAQVQLCTALGTPEGQLIAMAVEAAIPQPYRLIVQEALTLLCHQRGAGRQALVGLGAFVVFMALIALLGVVAE